MKIAKKSLNTIFLILLFIFISGYIISFKIFATHSETVETITYEQFGAVGDGKTNDIEAIRKAHEYANRKYIETGIPQTVSACNTDDCSNKTYYIGESSGKGQIDVITNINWKNAKFIIDDYIDKNNDRKNDVNITENLFYVTSPLAIYAKQKGTDLSYLTYDSTILQNLSSNRTINPNTKNLKELTNYLYEGKVNKNTFYNNNVASIESYYNTKRWIIEVCNNNKMWIRSGTTQDPGINQKEIIVIDRQTGDILTDIEWTYDNIIEIKVYPIPDNKISISNGNFNRYTNNVVYSVGSNGNAVKNSYTKRSIYIEYTGNVEFNNLNHYIDESIHSYTSTYQKVSNGNLYSGFIMAVNSANISINNVSLVPHTPVRMVTNNTITKGSEGTYDLNLDMVANVFIDKLLYSCNIYLDNGEKDWARCYGNNMISEAKWGIMGSNNCKNIFITNSKLNRIDAHRGVHNLYVADTTVGTSMDLKSLTLTGSGKFYGKNIKADNTDIVLNLREDYGSTWNGIMVFDNLNFVVNKKSTYPQIINSNNKENWNFGYTSYFPEIYINGLNIDTNTKDATNVKYVTFLGLSTLYSNGSTIRGSGNNLYYFKDNIYLSNLTTNGNTVKLFSDDFINSAVNTLNKDNYGGSNVVNLYLDSKVLLQGKVSSTSNTKFKKVNSMTDKSQEIRNYFEELIRISRMPETTPTPSETYITIDETQKIIKSLENQVKVSDFINQSIFEQRSITIYDNNNLEKTENNIVTTGDKLKFLDNPNNEYLISIKGDANGDGIVNIIDLVQIRKHIIQWYDQSTGTKYQKTGIYFDAIDINNDSEISLVDLVKLRKIIIKG